MNDMNTVVENVIASLISPMLRKPISSNQITMMDGYPLMIKGGDVKSINKAHAKRVLERFQYMTNQYSKVLQIRFDLHLPPDWKPNPTLENTVFSRFCRQMKHNYLERSLGLKHVQYAWCREIEKAKAAHYHVVVWVSGHEKRTGGLPCIDGTIAALNSFWSSATGGLLTHTESLVVRRKVPAELKAATYIASYICKQRGKAGNRKSGVRSFGASILKRSEMLH